MIEERIKNHRPSHPAWLRVAWVRWLLEKKAEHGLNNIEIAKRAGVAESYICLMTKGFIPVRRKVEALGRALGDLEGACAAAGLTVGEQDRMDVEDQLSNQSLQIVHGLAQLDHEEQDKLTTALRLALTLVGRDRIAAAGGGAA